MYTNSWKSSLFLGQQKSDMIMCAVASGILSIASWHWLFAINLPLGFVALLLGMKHLPCRKKVSKHKFDTISAVANAITFGLLIYTLDGFAHNERYDYLILQLVALLVVGTYYIRRQLGQESPLPPLDLLKIPIFRLSILTSICSFTAQMLAMTKKRNRRWIPTQKSAPQKPAERN